MVPEIGVVLLLITNLSFRKKYPQRTGELSLLGKTLSIVCHEARTQKSCRVSACSDSVRTGWPVMSHNGTNNLRFQHPSTVACLKHFPRKKETPTTGSWWHVSCCSSNYSKRPSKSPRVGNQATLSRIRRHYWILEGPRNVKWVIRQ